MRQTLTSLRSATLRWLDDPRGENWAPAGDFATVDFFIDRAYQALVDEVDLAGQAWNFQSQEEAPTITTASGTREYSIGQARQLVEVHERFEDGSQGPAIDIVPYDSRDDGDFGVYAFRQGTQGFWYVGMVKMPPVWPKLRVFYAPILASLRDGNAVPHAVPDDFQEIIALKAALEMKIEENREAGGLAAILAADLDRMRRKLSHLHGRHRGQRY